MPPSQPRILFYIPSRRKSIGMHDKRRFWLPGIGELLDFAHRVSDGSVHRNQASGLAPDTNRSHDIARPSVVQDLLFVKDLGDRNRGSPRLAESAVDLAQDAFWRIMGDN